MKTLEKSLFYNPKSIDLGQGHQLKLKPLIYVNSNLEKQDIYVESDWSRYLFFTYKICTFITEKLGSNY
jgi:hypothetical protein